MTEEVAEPVAPEPVQLPSLDEATARRDQLLQFFQTELPAMQAELQQLIGFIAGFERATQDAQAPGPNRAQRRAATKPAKKAVAKTRR